MLKEYYNILKNKGRLIFKSDNDVLFKDSLEYLNESQFKVLDVTYDYDGLDIVRIIDEDDLQAIKEIHEEGSPYVPLA